jgi:hypothetical protein
MSVRSAIVMVTALLCLVGCAKSSVSNEDVKQWQTAHDANGNAIPDQPSGNGR